MNTNISKVESKIPDTSGLMTKTVWNTNASEVDGKISKNSTCITTKRFNKLIAEHFAARLKQIDLVNKTDFDKKQTRFKRQITSNKTKHIEVQKELNS